MIIILLALKILVVLGVFSAIVVAHEFGHFIAAKKQGIKVESFAVGFGKKLFSIKKGETEYRINLIPLGGYVKLAGEDPQDRKGKSDEFASKPVISRFWVIFSGPLFNYILAFFILLLLYAVGIPSLTTQVGTVLDNSPAKVAGIRTGDTILSINNNTVSDWNQMVREIRSNTDVSPIQIKLERNDRIRKIKVTPRILETKNIFKQEIKFVGIGIAPSEKYVILKNNPLRAFDMSLRHMYYFTVNTYKGLWFLITGAMPIKESVGGPIRIIDMLTKAVSHGWYSVLSLMATISMAIAIFNLLPFPILDGGHILFLIIEKIKGKPISPKTQEMIQQVALVLIIMFFLYVTYNDVRFLSNIKK